MSVAPQVDAWESLLTNAGLEARDERPVPGGPLTPALAARLLRGLLGKPVTLGQFPSRLAVGHLLREVLKEGEVSRAELVRRVERFTSLAVLRPDGCLAWVRSGMTQQRIAAVQWRDGAFRAHGFELGRFYDGRSGVFRLLDDALQEVDGRHLAEVHDDADYVGRTLDGAEMAFVKLALSLGHFFTYPLDSIASLKNLPAGVAALIQASPEYFERFRYMTRGEQVQAVAELATNLLLTTGTAAATTRTVTGALAGAEATVPVLTLSAQGALTLERVAVPVGRAAAVLGGGPGAAIILHRANSAAGQPAPSGGKGPGQWGPSDEKGASARARAYQEQISGRSYDDAYWVGGVGRKSGGTKFDGFTDGILLEAKGPGYAEFFESDFAPKAWFEASGKAEDLIDQARRQSRRAEGKGIRIEWHVAEKHAADAIRRLLKGNDVTGIVVIHTPARSLVP
ncbi:Tox-REase-5 domain-containing protein [Myxococcus eversor]|uniref:Tox-REase-5 domain-containing protein n=1 Tax=Myxococcus eversor TaxID=2709661 RepID=UPI0023DDF9FF|nr:Tox-REase-5 domain-containing protein [Myxococcus eversor]